MNCSSKKAVWRWNSPFVFYWGGKKGVNINCCFKYCFSSHVQWRKKKERKKQESCLKFMILFLFLVLLLSLDLQIYLYCIFMCVHFNSIYCIQKKWAPVTLAPLSQWSNFFPRPCLVRKLAFLHTLFPSDTRSVILSEHLRPWYIILSQNHFCFFLLLQINK